MLQHPRILGAWLTAICLAATVSAEDTIPWASDLDAAFSQASRENKLVLIHFWSQSCAPCMSLERNVFRQSFVGQRLGSKFVPVRVDGNRDAAVAQQYNVRSWPTDVIVTPAGYIVDSSGCSQNAKTYVGKLEDIAMRQQMRTRGQGLPPRPGVQLASSAAPQPKAGSWPNQNYVYGNSNPAPAGQTYLPQQDMGANRSQLQQAQGYDLRKKPYRPGSTAQAPIGSHPQPGSQMLSRPAYAGNGQSNPYVNDVRGVEPKGIANPYAQSQGQSTGVPNLSQPYVDPNSFAGSSTQPAGPMNSGQARMTEQQNPYTVNSPQQSQPANNLSPAREREVYPGQIPTGPRSRQLVQNNPYAEQAPSNTRTRQQAPTAPERNPSFALDGYCAVSLVEKTSWKKGDVRWGGIHRGRTYLFASEAEQKAFMANPERYTPALSGIDPVVYFEQGQEVEGARKYGVYFRDHFYLFASEQSLQKFWGSPQSYASQVQHKMAQAAGNQVRR